MRRVHAALPAHFIRSLALSQTTCAVYRIWGQWVAGYKGPVMGVEAPTIVFVTASATLKAQVSKAFRKLQVGLGLLKGRVQPFVCG